MRSFSTPALLAASAACRLDPLTPYGRVKRSVESRAGSAALNNRKFFTIAIAKSLYPDLLVMMCFSQRDASPADGSGL